MRHALASRMHGRRLAAWLVAAVTLGMGGGTTRADPAIGTERLFAVPRAQTMERWDAAFDFALDYAYPSMLRTHLVAAVGLDPVDLGVALPITLHQDVGTGGHAAMLGDLRLDAKVRFTPRIARWHLAGMLLTSWPTGAASVGGGGGAYGLEARAVADFTLTPRVRFAGYLGYLLDLVPIAATATTAGMLDTASALTVGVGVEVAVIRGKLDLYGELWGQVGLAHGGGGYPLESDAGAKYFLPHDLVVFGSVGNAAIYGSAAPRARFLAGLTWVLRPAGRPPLHAPPPDRDEDGVPDDEDRCPDEPATEDDSDGEGCPRLASPGIADTPAALAQRLADGILLAFDAGSATLTPDAARRLALIAPIVLAHPEWPGVLVAGYSDGKTPADRQFALSAARADAVKQFLVEIGKVPEARLWADGFGTAAPRRRKGEFYSLGFVKLRIGSQAGAPAAN